MSTTKPVIINGQAYDSVSGLPIAQPAQAPHEPTPHRAAPAVHGGVQKSQTLQRSGLARPAAKPAVPTPPKKRGVSLDIARHPQVKKFAPTTKAPTPASTTPDLPVAHHPVAAAAHTATAQKKKPGLSARAKAATRTKQAKKAAAQTAAVAPATPKRQRVHHHVRSFMKKHPRLFSTGVVVAGMVIVGAGLVWTNLAPISVSLASAQADMTVRYPSALPAEYRLVLPIQAQNGRAVVTFASQTNQSSFTLSQAKSLWDSDAVRAMVAEQSNSQFLTSQDRGLTVYTYNGNAAWVNKGVLYTIEGNAPLTGEQILTIANSL